MCSLGVRDTAIKQYHWAPPIKKLTGTEKQEGEQKSLRRVGCGDVGAGIKGQVLRTKAGSKLHVSPALPS